MADDISDQIRAQCDAVAAKLDAQGLKDCQGCPEKGWRLRDGLCADCYEESERKRLQVVKGEEKTRQKERRDIDG